MKNFGNNRDFVSQTWWMDNRKWLLLNRNGCRHRFCSLFVRRARCIEKRREEAVRLARLFAVYKVENGKKVLLGGLAERRKSRRKDSNLNGLVEMAKRKYATVPDDKLMVVLEEV